VLLKFDVNGTLLWERTFGGPDSDTSLAVAAAPDGSAYIAGTATSFGPSSLSLFVVKFDSLGNLVWQRISDGAEGNAVAVGPDGSVYAAGTTPRPGMIGNFDLLVLKITFDGNLVWQRTYSAGDVVDPRGGMTVASDGSVYMAGAIQTVRRTADIAALIVKLSTNGDLLFDKQFDGRGGETGTGVAVAPDDGTVYVAGTTTSFGAGSQDAFVLHLLPTGKKLLDAVTWGGTGFEEGSGVGVITGTVALAATTSNPPPYSLLAASARLSALRGTLAAVAGILAQPAGISADPAAGTATPTGTTIFGGNFEAALVRIAR
jgi:DNA-binding beta-propeller fold protein YncE